MKKILLALATVAMVFAGCNKGLEDRLTKLENRVSDIEAFVTNLNAEVEGLQIIVSNLQKNVYVTGYADIKNTSGAVIGYEITFNEGNPIKIYHGNTGETGAKGDAGATPTIDYYDENPDDEVDGEWYWKSGDDWIRDLDNNMIPVYKNVEFSVVEGVLFVAVGNADPISLGSIKGEQGDSMFEGVTVDEQKGTVTINLKGTEKDLVLPLNAFNFNLQVPESYPEIVGAPIEIAYTISDAYAANTVVRAYPSKGLEAVVDKENSKIIVTIGSVAGYVDVYAINNETGEIKAKTVDFNAGERLATTVTETKLYLSPDGTGSFEIPVATAQNYTVDITLCPWLEYSISQTKAYREETITFTAKGENTSGTKNEGTIVLKGEDGEELFSVEVSQPDYVKELLGEYIESYTMSYATHTGTLVIELSDDFSKGVYKTTICGTEMYADYRLATEENKSNEYVLYYQTKSSKYEYPIKVSDDFNLFSSDGFGIPGAYGMVTVSNYLAVTPLGPAQLTPDENALVGVYNEIWTHGKNIKPAENAMVISASEEAAYGQLKVKLLVTSDGSAYEGYATLEGNKLSVAVGGQSHPKFGTIWNSDAVIELTVNTDGTLSMSSWKDSKGSELTNYVATKYVEGGDDGEGDDDDDDDDGESAGVTIADLINTTWSETFKDFSGSHSGTMSINETDDESKGDLKVKMLAYQTYSAYYVECYADLDTAEKTLTVKTDGVDYIGWGVKCGGDIVLEISEAGTKMTMTNIISLHYGNLESYTAIKN